MSQDVGTLVALAKPLSSACEAQPGCRSFTIRDRQTHGARRETIVTLLVFRCLVLPNALPNALLLPGGQKTCDGGLRLGSADYMQVRSCIASMVL